MGFRVGSLGRLRMSDSETGTLIMKPPVRGVQPFPCTSRIIILYVLLVHTVQSQNASIPEPRSSIKGKIHPGPRHLGLGLSGKPPPGPPPPSLHAYILSTPLYDMHNCIYPYVNTLYSPKLYT